MTNLLALCRVEDQLQIKKVNLTQPVQGKLGGLFQAQANTFMDGITEEVEFGGDWKPDAEEVLYIEAPEEAAAIFAAADGDLLALPAIDAANFAAENIKGLCVVEKGPTGNRILIQCFSAQQILARRFSLLLDGNSFKELTDPAFTLDNYLVAILEGDRLKFKNFHMVKRVFALKQLYEEASDQEIDLFCGHDSLQVESIETFKQAADQTIRKMVHAISKANVLANYTVQEISDKAAQLGLEVEVNEGKLVMPQERKAIKNLLRFLDDGIYEAALSATKYVTNSKRPFAGS